jgi:hypothetical protein
MNTITTHWKVALDKQTNDFKELLSEFSEQELNWKPDLQTWSLAQNLDHLITINSSYFPIIDLALNKKLDLAWTGRISFIYNMMGKFILKSVQPDRRRKMKTFPVWMPSQSNISIDILSYFENHQLELKQYIDKSQSLLLNNAVIYSPASKAVVYKLSTAFDIIVAHEQRHYNQSFELVKVLKSAAF